MADYGYEGNKKVIYANSSETAEVADFKGQARLRQEAFNAKIKASSVFQLVLSWN